MMAPPLFLGKKASSIQAAGSGRASSTTAVLPVRADL